MMNPQITIVKTKGGAMTAGLYNNLLYYITEDGDVEVKYVSSLNLNKANIDKIRDIFPWGDDSVTIASLKSFPLDSIVNDNILAIATIEGLKILPIKGRYVGNDVKSIPNVRPISITRFGGYIAFSLEKDGIFLVDRLDNAVKGIHLKIESDRIISCSEYALNLYSDSTPKLLDTNDVNVSNEDGNENSYLKRELVVLKGIEETLTKNDVIGREVSIAYTDGKCIIFGDEDNNLYTFGLGKGKKSREHVYSKNKAFFDTYLSRESRLNLIANPKHCIHDNDAIREQRSILLHYHPSGLIEQYLDHVDFIDNSGKRTILIEGEDIAEVRTHIRSHAYRTIVTIAAENHVVIANITSTKQ